MEPKICKECKHCSEYENAQRYQENYVCHALEKTTTNLVTGEKTKSGLVFCHYVRESNKIEDCGPLGKFWEKKET